MQNGLMAKGYWILAGCKVVPFFDGQIHTVFVSLCILLAEMGVCPSRSSRGSGK